MLSLSNAFNKDDMINFIKRLEFLNFERQNME